MGVPASLGPGLRTVSGAKRSLGATLPPRAVCTMSEVHRQSRKTRFALAVAEGISPQRWARKNKVSKSTVYRWAKEPKVRARIDSIRCRAIDRAVGRMAKHATWAVEGIVKLADNATSESVRLAALRTIYTQLTQLPQEGIKR